jgi:hypothetical protein
METTRNNAWTRTAPGALFAGAVSAAPSCVVMTGAAALAGVGAVAMVALIFFVPACGTAIGRVVVMPQ